MSQWSRYRRRAKRAGTLTIFIGAALWTGAVVYGQRDGGRAPATAPSSAPAASSEVLAQRALIDRYCVTCHNERLKARERRRSRSTRSTSRSVPAHAENWEKVVPKLRAGLMPPAGRPRPDKTSHRRSRGWLETRARSRRGGKPESRADRGVPSAESRRVSERRSRSARTWTWTWRPCCRADDVSVGFDNIASVLTVSPTLMDRYLAAAQKISRLAVGTPAPLPNVDYLPGRRRSRTGRSPARPAVRHARRHAHPLHVPDRRRVRRSGSDWRATSTTACRSIADAQQLEVSLDGRRGCRCSRCRVRSRPPRAERVSPAQPPRRAEAAAAAATSRIRVRRPGTARRPAAAAGDAREAAQSRRRELGRARARHGRCSMTSSSRF